MQKGGQENLVLHPQPIRPTIHLVRHDQFFRIVSRFALDVLKALYFCYPIIAFVATIGVKTYRVHIVLHRLQGRSIYVSRGVVELQVVDASSGIDVTYLCQGVVAGVSSVYGH